MRATVSVETFLRPTLLVLVCVLVPAVIAGAEENPLSAHTTSTYGGVKKILLRAAETMPEEKYAYQPADTVRTFGQILGHVADSQYAFCSAALGEKNPSLKIEKTRTSKADLIAALNDAFAYCDRAYVGMTDAKAGEPVKLMGRDAPKLGALNVNNVHSIEHYGNLVTYLRMNGLVPPTSDKEFMSQLMK